MEFSLDAFVNKCGKPLNIAVGLSGGVDSSVAALLLKHAGHNVIAMYMQNWHDITGTLHGDCQWEEEKILAEMVAKKIGIPFHFVDLSATYRKRVVDYMFSEYERGRTPNPDVLCNREIKFDAFLECALELGVDYVATGHYCKKGVAEPSAGNSGNTTYSLFAGDDGNKDQSYFLCQLNQKQLSRALFPIGHLDKPTVRLIAKECGLPSAEKKDSQGICFVGKVDLPVFLQQKLKAKEGDVVEIFEDKFERILKFNSLDSLVEGSVNPHSIEGYDLSLDNEVLERLSLSIEYHKSNGKVIGKHQGAQFYTIGQRHGLNIGGHKESIFVISTDIENNIIYVGEGQNHSGLYRKCLKIENDEIHWIRPDLEMADGQERDYLVRIRYRQPLQRAKLFKREGGMFILFERAQRGVTPGQFAAWYTPSGELCGSGAISR